ncbi:MAG: hypothetical protein ACRDBY_04670 [Cetobacterium sp.]
MNKPKLTKPVVGASIDLWGDVLNKNIDIQDSYNQELIEDSSRQDQELARLERDKISQSDLTTVVQNTVDNYVDNTSKPQLNHHVETVNKPELDNYTDTKKLELNNLTTLKKEELNAHEKVKEVEITQFVEVKKGELVQYVDTVSKVEINSHTEKKKQEIDSFTEAQKLELDSHEKIKEGELDVHEKTKESQLDSYVETVNKVELKNYVDSKKGEIDSFTEAQKVELNEHEKLKEGEFDEYIAGKIGGIDSHVESKKNEINTFTEEQKVELDAYEKVKEGQLESFKDGKKVEITNHTDAEIERINATGIDVKQDKTDNTLETKDKTVVGAINELLSEKENLITRSNAINSESTTDVATSKAVNDLRLEVNKKTINAGDGLATTIDVGGGQKISITPKNESILVDNDSIWVNIVNDFTTGGVNKVASAESIKVLKQLIDTLGGGGATKLLRASEALGEYDYMGNLTSGGISITVGARLFNPTLYLDGVRLEENRYSVEFETGLITLNEPYANYDVVWVVEDKMPYHVTFCFPTMNLLLASEDIKSRIKLGNVIKILGESDEDDGGHYLVKCQETQGLNGVQIGTNKWLNEIPNTRIKTIVDKANSLETNKLGKTEKAVDSDKLDGQDSTYFAKQTDMTSANTQINQNKSDILLKANKNNPIFTGMSKFPRGYSTTLSGIVVKNYIDEVGGKNICIYTDSEGNLNIRGGGVGEDFSASNNTNIYIRQNDKPSRVLTMEDIPISKSENGWCKFANGLIIQWGLYKSTTTTATIKLHVALSSTGAKLSLNPRSLNNANITTTGVIENTSSFVCNVSTATVWVDWIVIGY